MSRQQRTNYKRQRPTPSTPRQFSDFVWTITRTPTETSQTVLITGDLDRRQSMTGSQNSRIVGSSKTLSTAAVLNATRTAPGDHRDNDFIMG
jgi:hypothetical protein